MDKEQELLQRTSILNQQKALKMQRIAIALSFISISLLTYRLFFDRR